MTERLTAAVLQFRVGMDIGRNLARLMKGIEELKPGTFAVAPEGALSGYAPRPGFVHELDHAAIEQAIETVRSRVAEKGIHLVAGACIRDGALWRNAGFYFGPDGREERYDKINLAVSERPDFSPGDSLQVFRIMNRGMPLSVGIQMCREIRYPEQWRMLARDGAQLIAYVNNAVGSEDGDQVWRAHMVSRAAETQRFVLGANNAAADQKCPSMIVSPSGAILAEVENGAEGIAEAALNLGEVSNWILDQAREDVVSVGPAAQPLAAMHGGENR